MENEEEKIANKKHMIVRIFEDGSIIVRGNDKNPVYTTLEPNEPFLPGPINTYHQGLWYSGSPICFWHGGQRYCIR
jgi:hypothetical protein